MMRRIAAVALAAAVLTGAAHAQSPSARSQTAEPAAGARAEAARLIAEAKAGDLFEDASSGTVPGARHLRSGLVCSFEPGSDANRIFVLEEGAGPRGDDVACATQVLGVSTTLYATRYPKPVSAEQALDDAIRGIAAQFPGASEYVGKAANVEVDPKTPGAATRQRARVLVEIDGAPALAKVDVAEVNGWIFKLRATGPLEPELATDLFAEIAFAATLSQLSQAAPTR